MGRNRLTDDERRTWRLFLLAHGRVLARLDADLVRECDMTLAEYEVLVHLAEAPEHQRRMNELADLARLSPSGLTRRFDALVRRGWVARERCDDDRRGVLARLTPAGLERVRAAEPVHTEGARAYLLDPLDDRVGELASMMERIAQLDADDRRLAQA